MPRWLAAFCACILALAGATFVRAAINTRPSHNNLGAEVYSINPNVYLYGSLACRTEDACTVMQHGDKIVTNVRINPAHTYSLFDEGLTLCGNVGDAFDGIGAGPIVITYRRVSHQLVNGIACHDLLSVHKVETKSVLP